jgi:general secretion pathway protein E
MSFFSKPKTPSSTSTSAEPSSEKPKSGANDATSAISVYDPGSASNITIHGAIITNSGGEMELPEDLRQILIASDQGDIFYSRSHQNNARLLSEIAKIEAIRGPAATKAAIDMSSLTELYHRSNSKSRVSSGGRRNDTSKMQRELIAIVSNASSRNSSDIHIIVNADRAYVQFRVDGIIEDIQELQPQYGFELLAAAHAMADASDAAYQVRNYQGARISSLTTELPTGVQSLRLQFNPLANDGRMLVMRILYSGDGRKLQLSDLGYNQEQVRQISIMSARPVGINVISGPTGSGKSTTLKAVLERLIEKRNGEIKTLTIEDPPEYIIDMAQQMPVTNAKTQEERSAAFIEAISAGLRSDPDVLMIGEVRDRASADLAVEGALSGHPIYASLHANTAMDILSRLRDMGIEDFKVFDASVFSGLVGQRLVRQLCSSCKQPYAERVKEGQVDPLLAERIDQMQNFTPKQANPFSSLYVANPGGCSECSQGYKGRAVVAEIILPDDHFMELMANNQKVKARAYWFSEKNGLDMLGSSWLRALEGRVSPLDIENSVALIAPMEEHRQALDYWLKTDGGDK